MWKEKEMSILSSLGRLAAEISEHRARNRTERAIGALPVELRKDIGWPDATRQDRSGQRRRIMGRRKVNSDATS